MQAIVASLKFYIARVDGLNSMLRSDADRANRLSFSEWQNVAARVAETPGLHDWTLNVLGGSVQDFNTQPLENRLAFFDAIR